jgi:hypothetical protein
MYSRRSTVLAASHKKAKVMANNPARQTPGDGTSRNRF